MTSQMVIFLASGLFGLAGSPIVVLAGSFKVNQVKKARMMAIIPAP